MKNVIFVIENADGTKLEHSPRKGIAKLFDKDGRLIKEIQLKEYERAWGVPDPKAEKYKNVSPYVINNPMKYIDPNGEDVTDYQVGNFGHIYQIGMTNNKPDRLYGIYDAKTNTIPYITVNDKSILPALAGESNIQNQVYPDNNEKTRTIISYNEKGEKKVTVGKIKTMIDGHYAETTSKSDAQNVFQFAASNSNVEWGINGNKDGNWAVGTLNKNAQGLTFGTLGKSYSSKNIIYDAHSHPGNTEFDFRPSNNDMSRAIYIKNANPNSSTWLFMPKNPANQ